MISRKEIKANSKAAFKGYYGPSVGAFIVSELIISACTCVSGLAGSNSALTSVLSVLSGLLIFFVSNIILVGQSSFFLKVYRQERPEFSTIFSAGFNNYAHNLGGMSWMLLFNILWTLLFIVPGIIKSIAYSMTPFILTDCPNVPAKQAVKVSMKLTKGYKGRIFGLMLSFIGWQLLSVLTCCILDFLYVGPYYTTSFAGMYEELKNSALQEGRITAEELGL